MINVEDTEEIMKSSIKGDSTDDTGSLNFGEVQLSPIDSVCNLGVYFDSKLNFKEHID
ncbi:hypothetical protein Hamer_G002755, partial [Homarus americanus]